MFQALSLLEVKPGEEDDLLSLDDFVNAPRWTKEEEERIKFKSEKIESGSSFGSI
jgi:hypothetical protein